MGNEVKGIKLPSEADVETALQSQREMIGKLGWSWLGCYSNSAAGGDDDTMTCIHLWIHLPTTE